MKKLHMFFMVAGISMCLQAMDIDHEKTVQIDLSVYMQKIKKLSDTELQQESLTMQYNHIFYNRLVKKAEDTKDMRLHRLAENGLGLTIKKYALLKKMNSIQNNN